MCKKQWIVIFYFLVSNHKDNWYNKKNRCIIMMLWLNIIKLFAEEKDEKKLVGKELLYDNQSQNYKW